ncbi:hypothetical protein CMEL01_01328 [Colletotrichum melonis]|uniref:Uncharacterized protein n=2 Tax=Colletotrichum acutatum species complex TaxID=2707335 RepID=A0AAI9V2T7_9PEZI|nr:hypothetical protein CMEL01_01328 [Colletotrichum melonis]
MGKHQLYPLSTMVWICCCRCQNKPSKVLGGLCFSGEATTQRPTVSVRRLGACVLPCVISPTRVSIDPLRLSPVCSPSPCRV